MREIPEYETIRFEFENGIGRLIMDRPFVHNAFNADMVADMLDATRVINTFGPELRVVVLTGEGRSFCAGADVNWLQEIKNQTYEGNIRESLEMSDLMYAIYSLKVPTIARVNGPVIGCGIGFVCACDMAVATDKSIFSVSDVKLGVSPAVALPYIVRKIGESNAREMCLTGSEISASRALAIGLVHRVVKKDKLDEMIDHLCFDLMTSAPDALRVTKELMEKLSFMTFSEARVNTAEVISKQRISEEGQEGMECFIKKWKPSWYPDKEK